eukprot:583212_1
MNYDRLASDFDEFMHNHADDARVALSATELETNIKQLKRIIMEKNENLSFYRKLSPICTIIRCQSFNRILKRIKRQTMRMMMKRASRSPIFGFYIGTHRGYNPRTKGTFRIKVSSWT